MNWIEQPHIAGFIGRSIQAIERQKHHFELEEKKTIMANTSTAQTTVEKEIDDLLSHHVLTTNVRANLVSKILGKVRAAVTEVNQVDSVTALSIIDNFGDDKSEITYRNEKLAFERSVSSGGASVYTDQFAKAYDQMKSIEYSNVEAPYDEELDNSDHLTENAEDVENALKELFEKYPDEGYIDYSKTLEFLVARSYNKRNEA